MQVSTRSSYQKLKFPPTQVFHLLDNQMTMFIRAWGSQEYSQKFIDEVSHYLSSSQADIDITSPFEYKESLSSLANKTRIALLLAHDFFYKVENKTEYTVGFEALIFFQTKNELAWAGSGRFRLQKIYQDYAQTFFDIGSDLDSETLLPIHLLGVENEVEINAGSLSLEQSSRLLLSSVYGGEVSIQNFSNGELYVQPTSDNVSYWYSSMRRD